MSYDEADVTCSMCANDNSVFGYMVYAPCGVNAEMSAVTTLITVGGAIAVAVGETKQTPVFYVMEDNSLVTPKYTDLTFTSAAPATATVSEEGVISGVAAGTTTITIATKVKKNNSEEPLYSTTLNVRVTE